MEEGRQFFLRNKKQSVSFFLYNETIFMMQGELMIVERQKEVTHEERLLFTQNLTSNASGNVYSILFT